MQKISLATAEHLAKKRVTHKERFLAEMEQAVPWQRLLGLIEPYCPKGQGGRPTVGLERMLRLYFVQQWYVLSDEAVEDAVQGDNASAGDRQGQNTRTGGAPVSRNQEPVQA